MYEIGDFGIGSDACLSLDFKKNRHNPRRIYGVIYGYHYAGCGDHYVGWEQCLSVDR
jgi:hypothetical protein